MRITIIVLSLLVSCFSLNAANKESKKADQFFEKGDYTNAITFYNEAYSKETDPSERALYKYKMGECNYRINKLDAAERHLNDAIRIGYQPPEAYLLLGDVQLKLGKQDEALTSYESYELANPQDPIIRIKKASVQFAKENQHNLSLFKLDELKSINTASNEFGVSYFNESIIFSSTRRSALDSDDEKESDRFDDRVIDKKEKTSYTKGGVNKTVVMLSVGMGGNYQRPKEILELSKMKNFADDGVVRYDPYSKRAYFTRIEGKKAFIYALALEKNQWKVAEKIEVQSQGEPIGHPFMTPEGDRIYFTSTMPGGKGKSDIWYITQVGNGWSAPVNAGDNINTPGNDVYPFISDGYFFFSSDGRIGFGGLDIFVSKMTGSSFSTALNLGAPFNSPGDDYNLVIRTDKKEGMLVSSRNAKRGDDIFQFEGFPSNLKITGSTRDVYTRAPISNASLELFIENKSLDKVFSDQNGDFIIPVRPNTTYRLKASVAGYAPAEKTFSSPGDLYAVLNKDSGIDLDFAMQSNSSVISGRVLDATSISPIQGVVVNLISGGKVIDNVSTDPSGIYKFSNFKNNNDYIVRVDPKGFFFDSKQISVPNTAQSVEYSKATGHDLDFDLQRYEPQKAIIVPNIYFQEGRANILTESYKSLDRLAYLFNNNPQCKILLKGYVDVGISADVANTLSKRRVDAIRDYLLTKKVNPDQILVQAMGRQDPIMRSPSNEAERQMNNRITYTVTRVDAVKELEYALPVSSYTPQNQPLAQQTPTRQTTTNTANTAQQTPVQQTQQPVQPIQQPVQQTGTTNTAQQQTPIQNNADLPYIVQVASLATLDLDRADFKKIRTQLGVEVKHTLVNGLYKYYVGGYSTLPEAKDMAEKLGNIGIAGAWARSKY